MSEHDNRDMSSSDPENIDALRVLLVEGEESGEAMAFDFDAFIAEKLRRVHPRNTHPATANSGSKIAPDHSM